MTGRRFFRYLSILTAASTVLAAQPALAGPPYQTDDPEPVAYRNYEIYIGFEGAYGAGDNETSLPFAEINYGPLPNVQIAASFPLAIGATPANATHYGVGNVDFGIKYRFMQETKTQPQISFYPSIGVPTGIQSVEAEANEQTLFLPLWAQKDIGRFTIFGGGGWERNPGTSNRNFWSGGLAGVYNFSNRINAGLEVYGNGSERAGDRGSTGIGIGMNDDYSAIHSILFSFGQSIAGERSYHGYLAYELRLGPAKSQDREQQEPRFPPSP
jgi:hypothetical protein